MDDVSFRSHEVTHKCSDTWRTDTLTHRRTDAQTHRHIATQSRRHAETQTHRRTDAKTHRRTHTHERTQTDTRTQIRTFIHTEIYMCTWFLVVFEPRTRVITHTLAHTQATICRLDSMLFQVFLAKEPYHLQKSPTKRGLALDDRELECIEMYFLHVESWCRVTMCRDVSPMGCFG